MDDLRSEIRAAFEKEQATHPPAAGLRPSVVAAVTRQPRRSPNLEWLAVAAAILLGVLVVAGLMAQRLSQHATTPVGAQTPKPSQGADYGPPPAGVQLLYVHDPNHPTWLIGYDWSGRPRATVKLTGVQPNVGMAPDGQSFAIGLGAKGGNWQFLDRLGQPVASPGTLPGAYSTLWADDSRHVCSMTFDPQTLDYTLWTALPGEPIKRVMVVAHDPAVGQTGVSLAACSFKNDLAIAVRFTTSYPSEMWVVRLSTGTVIGHRNYASGTLANVIASPDGTFTAENAGVSSGQTGSSAASTVIRRTSDGSVVASLDPTVAVLGFSGDDSAVLVTRVPWVGPLTHLAVFDMTGREIWSDDGTETYGGFVAMPAGQDFALHYQSPTAQGPEPTTIFILHGDGRVTQFPGLYEPTW